MFKRYRFHLAIVVLLIVLGWQMIDLFTIKKEPISLLEVSLQSAGDNRSELEKVLRYYQKNPFDSLKYKAACFLIENMPYYTYSIGEQLDNYKKYYVWLKRFPNKSPEEIADSVKKVFGPLGQLEKKHDIQEVDSAYLCSNIEWAFKVWQEQPWGKNITFDVFCEYILPYRIDDEPLAYWREIYYEKYNSLLDSLRMSDELDKEDPIVVANYLRKRLPIKKHRFTTFTPGKLGHLGPESVQELSGSCRDATDFGIYLYRALGIPCAIDFLPMRGDYNTSHFWMVAWNKNGEEYMSEFPSQLGLVRDNLYYKSENSPKVFRYHFSLNRAICEAMAMQQEEIHPFWRLPKFEDVTLQYAFSYNEELKIPSSKLYPERKNGKIAYLCVSSRNDWFPIDWTVYNPNNLVFRNVKKGCIMRVATYEKGQLVFLTDPFYVDKWTNEMYFYSADKEKQEVVLYAKHTIDEEYLFRNRVLGGVFEASNRPDFAEKDTLFIIQRRPYRLNTTVKCWSDKKYRYFRYVSKKYAHGNIAEIAFYQPNDTIALKGKVIGTPGSPDGKHEYTNVFDGKTWTSFDYPEPVGGWAGLDIGKEVQVDRITYSPRNRDNYIRPGDVFELFYCDREWKSAGIVHACSDSLVYRDIPKNAILLLRNHTRGVAERIFVYENNVQLWK